MRKTIVLLLFPILSGVSLFAQDTTIKYLSGIDKDHPVQWDLFCTGGHKSGKWTTIGVPSNCELQGFGNYSYGHEKAKSNEQGFYKRTLHQAGWPVYLEIVPGTCIDRLAIDAKADG